MPLCSRPIGRKSRRIDSPLHHQLAVVDLMPDPLISRVPAQLALIEEGLDPARTQGLANPLGSLRIL